MNIAQPEGCAFLFSPEVPFPIRPALHFPKNTKWELVAMKNSKGTDRKKLVREAMKAWRASAAALAGGVPASVPLMIFLLLGQMMSLR